MRLSYNIAILIVHRRNCEIFQTDTKQSISYTIKKMWYTIQYYKITSIWSHRDGSMVALGQVFHFHDFAESDSTNNRMHSLSKYFYCRTSPLNSLQCRCATQFHMLNNGLKLEMAQLIFPSIFVLSLSFFQWHFSFIFHHFLHSFVTFSFWLLDFLKMYVVLRSNLCHKQTKWKIHMCHSNS